jgi:hypothetical protein
MHFDPKTSVGQMGKGMSLGEALRDLHIHFHQENNILHPQAKRLETPLAAAHVEAGKGID